MARKRRFLGAAFPERFKESYARLSHERQKGADEVVMALLKQQPTPGMRIKPIHPEKYYQEARINAGDRLIFRVEDGQVWFIDVVGHDDIDRYGSKVSALF